MRVIWAVVAFAIALTANTAAQAFTENKCTGGRVLQDFIVTQEKPDPKWTNVFRYDSKDGLSYERYFCADRDTKSGYRVDRLIGGKVLATKTVDTESNKYVTYFDTKGRKRVYQKRENQGNTLETSVLGSDGREFLRMTEREMWVDPSLNLGGRNRGAKYGTPPLDVVDHDYLATEVLLQLQLEEDISGTLLAWLTAYHGEMNGMLVMASLSDWVLKNSSAATQLFDKADTGTATEIGWRLGHGAADMGKQEEFLAAFAGSKSKVIALAIEELKRIEAITRPKMPDIGAEGPKDQSRIPNSE